MGYLSCNAETAIATCHSLDCELLTRKPRKKHPRRPFKIAEFSYSDLRSATNGFSDHNLLGKGSHGSVYKVHLQHNKLIAAVKKTKQTQHDTGGCTSTSPADNEVEILSHVYHPRIVNLLGFANDPDYRKLIVVEYMPNGTLYELLHGSGKPPGWVKRVRFVAQIARAAQFLHASNPPVIHRDIKSTNILIDSHFNARLSDFGLALRGHVEDVKVKCTPPAGTFGYLDPGYLAPGDLSTKSDVFSFGILLLEIISGRNAIDMNYSPSSVVDWAVPAIKSGDFSGICDPRIGPLEDAEALRIIAVVAARCVRSTAAKRPGMAEVVECLNSAYKRLKAANIQIWNNFGRRVGRVGESSRVVRYELLDESTVRVGSRRNGKVSNVTGVETVNNNIGNRIGRSKSIGSSRETEFRPSDFGQNHLFWRVGLGRQINIERLSKSRSMGILQSTRLVNNNGVVRNSNGRKLEESNLLVDTRKKDPNGEIY
ncbi:Serine/threonine-protein kinase-like protein [Forsythia ovata]|uniref:Serine/threonine-protein kinase-like protein n=1 Tax=Forsythia ovata TaxID=205694 RepID=A0ABD1S8B6_9LAMI